MAAFNEFFFQSVLISGIASTHVQYFALGLVELYEVLKFVQVPLNSAPFLCWANSRAQLRVICKLAEGALDPTVHVTDEGIKSTSLKMGPKGTPFII